MAKNDSPLRLYVVGLIALAAAVFLGLWIGSVSQPDLMIITQLRLPRVLMAAAVGMGLAVSGAVLQALFSNPLCEPYTLGISSGSALGAVIGISLGLSWNIAGIVGSAVVGAAIFAGVLFLISLRPGSGALTLLLAGVMLGFLGSSLVALWMAMADPNGLQGAILWIMGDISQARLLGAVPALILVLIFTFVIWTRWRELDALLTGEEGALSLGVPVSSVRRRMVLLVSILVGICVSGSGQIGFVGLVVPHFIRFRAGSLHRSLIPLSAIWGAITLIVADAIARTVIRPYELPVGVVTALVGAPMFLWIMMRRREVAA
jgi:iron complex transport system permease protein